MPSTKKETRLILYCRRTRKKAEPSRGTLEQCRQLYYYIGRTRTSKQNSALTTDQGIYTYKFHHKIAQDSGRDDTPNKTFQPKVGIYETHQCIHTIPPHMAAKMAHDIGQDAVGVGFRILRLINCFDLLCSVTCTTDIDSMGYIKVES